MRAVTAAILLALVGSAGADDEVKLKNGDRLTGKVTSLAGGKLILETTHSGPLKIDWAQVVSVKTDATVKVKLVTGELFEGKVAPGAEGRLKVETTGPSAAVEVDLVKVKAFNEAPTQWHGNLTASGKITEGNTRTKSFLVSAEGTRETEQDVILVRALFHYGMQNGVLTERNSYGIGKYMYKFTPAFYGYVSEELVSDTFKDIELESITSIGVGYDILKESVIDWSLEAGIAYFNFNYKVTPDEAHMGARVASKLRIALPLGMEFKDLLVVYPNFKDSQNYQLRNEATLGTSLGGGWNLLGGVITEFTNKPVNPGVKQVDDTYFLGIGYVF